MKKLRKFTNIILLILASSFLIGGMGYIAFRFWIVKPYKEFQVKEYETVPLFDALNENVEHNLPSLSSDSSLVSKWSIGMDPSSYRGHGRWLYMEISTNMTAEDVLAYYRSGLLDSGWLINQSRHSFDSSFYFRGTSCIEIDPPSQNYHQYEVVIWHDYRSQTFAPSLPNSLSMKFYEYEGSDFTVCP